MPDAGADAQLAAFDRQPIQGFDAVDIDKMQWSRQPEGHHRYEALTASEYAPFLRRHFSENADGFVDSLWCVVVELRGFHFEPTVTLPARLFAILNDDTITEPLACL